MLICDWSAAGLGKIEIASTETETKIEKKKKFLLLVISINSESLSSKISLETTCHGVFLSIVLEVEVRVLVLFVRSLHDSKMQTYIWTLVHVISKAHFSSGNLQFFTWIHSYSMNPAIMYSCLNANFKRLHHTSQHPNSLCLLLSSSNYLVWALCSPL